MLLIAAVALLGARKITQGGLGWSDAPQHAMDGAFLLALLRDLPLGDLRAWAEQFYVRHPALGIIVYYPPGFALVEALFYAVGGVGVVAARVCVLAHAAGASVLMVLIGARWFDRRTGLAAALLLLTCPHGAAWLFDVMLEWPATFWLLLTIFCYLRFRETQATGWAAAASAAFLMSVLTKQPTGLIAPVLLAHLLCTRDGRLLFRRPLVLATGLAAAAVVGGYFLFARRFTALPRSLVQPDLSDPAYYLARLGETAGWPLVMLAAVGLISLVRDRRTGPTTTAAGTPLLPVFWFVAYGLFVTLISAKEPRYFFFALPPLAWWAATCCGIRLGRFNAGTVVVAWIIGLQAMSVLRAYPRHLPRYDAAVRALLDRGDADLVLVDAVRDGQFIFDAYCDPEARERIVTLRASKLLYARAARMKYGGQEFARTIDDVIAVLDRYAVRYVLLESALPMTDDRSADPLARRLLRLAVEDQRRFEPLARWPLRCGDPAWDAVELRLYRYRNCPERGETTVRLPMPSMGGDVQIPLPRPLPDPNRR